MTVIASCYSYPVLILSLESNTCSHHSTKWRWNILWNVFVWNFALRFAKIFWNTGFISVHIWEGSYEPFTMSWVVSAFSIGQIIDWIKFKNGTTFNINNQWKHQCCSFCDLCKSSFDCERGCDVNYWLKNLACIMSAKFVPCLLTDDQKDHRVKICQELLDRASNHESFTKTIITGDKTWAHGYDVEIKVKSSLRAEQNSPWTKKAGMSWSNLKMMCIFKIF